MYEKVGENSSFRVALLLDWIETSFQIEHWLGVKEVVEGYGGKLSIFSGGMLSGQGGVTSARNSIYELISKNNVDGLIVATAALSHIVSSQEIKSFCSRFSSLPLVSLGMKVEGLPSITVNIKSAFSQMMKHIIEAHGCKKIAYICGPEQHPHSKERYNLFIENMEKYKLQVDDDLIIKMKTSFPEVGQEAIRILIDERKQSCDAVVAFNDEIAIRAINALQNRNFDVPHDVIVIGIDNIPESRLTLPTLSTIDQKAQLMGKKAAERLYGIFTGSKQKRSEKIQARFIIRQSCGCFSNESQHAALNKVFLDVSAETGTKDFSVQDTAQGLYHFISKQFLSSSVKKSIQTWLYEITDSFFQEITQDYVAEEELFLRKLELALHFCVLQKIDPVQWEEILSELHKISAQYNNDNEIQFKVNNLLHQGRVLISHAVQRKASSEKAEYDQLVRHFRDLGNKLLERLDLTSILHILSERLPKAGLQPFFLCLYEEPVESFETKKPPKMFLALRHEKRPFISSEGIPIPYNNFIPKNVTTDKEDTNLLFQPLFAGSEAYGYIMHSAKPRLGVLYEDFRSRVSNAIKGAMLFNRVQKQAETLEEKVMERTKELYQSERRYRKFFDDDLTGDFIVDLEGKVLDCNRAFAKILGFPSADYAKGFQMKDLIPDKAAFEEMVNLFRAQKRLDYYETDLIRPDGQTVSIIANIIAMNDETGEFSYIKGYLFDNTPRKNLEEQLRQSQKMEALGRLAGGISHDFNNLLTAINGYSELILESLNEDSDIREDVEEIIKAGRRAGNLTGQLLAFSRRQVLKDSPINLNSIVEEMENLLRRLLPTHIQLVTDLCNNTTKIKADRNQIEQVIMNLVINARDAMTDQGGTVSIKTDSIIIDTTEYKQDHFLLPGAYVTLTVKDNGRGMSEETRRKIFDPFFTTKEPGKGTGLGLSTVYGIIRQSEGFLDVESVVDEGSRFCVYLPLTDSEEELEEKGETDETEMRGKEHILVIEDEKWVRTFIARLLRHRGYQVSEAGGVKEAEKIYKNVGDSLDMVISDIIMPEKNGFQIAEDIRQHLPKIHTLFMSGYMGDDLLYNYKPGKRINFIGKPFKAEDLLHKVREILDSQKRE